MIVVTAASGQLGRLVVRHLLLTEHVPADQISVLTRDAARATHPAEFGVEVRTADHDDPTSLIGAFGAGDRVLLISGNQFGQRVAQHANVINAAKHAGVALLAYTSILGGPGARFPVADDHLVTEGLIDESGLPSALLRNGWYTENYTAGLADVLRHGAVIGSAAPDSRIATASRDDYAAAAARVLAGSGHEGKTYELSGDSAWSLRDYAAEVSRQTGTPIAYQQLPAEQYHAVLTGAGVPAAMADIFTATEDAIDRGELAGAPGDLRRLIGRPTTPLATTVQAALQA